MFGANKSTGFSGFGTSTNTAFGSTSTGFGGGTSFGAANNTSSLFGSNTAANPGTGGSLFGNPSASTGFGTQPAGSAFSFGATPSSTGGLFGSTGQTASSSLFSTPASASTGFGGFGGFGSTTSQASTGGLFGGGGTSSAPSFSFGGTAQAQGGTTVPFNAPTGQDAMVKNGNTTNINIRHQSITAMKEYENKCFEELRMEDYAANRKSKQTGSTTTGGLFGATPATQAPGSGFMFGGNTGLGSTTNSMFGGFGSASSATSTPFNQSKSLFGTASTGQTGFGLGATQNTAKPLFGGAQTSQPALGAGGSSFFGTPAAGTSTAVGFGTNTQTGGLFGSKPTGFGTATTSGGLGGFGTGGSLFGKPASTAASFGFGTNTSTSGFGGTSGSLFNKPTGFGATSTGLGTGGTFGFGGGLGTGATSTFGAATSKPAGFGGFNFGQTNTGTTGFGSALGGGTGTSTFSGLGGGGGLTLGASAVAAPNNAQVGQHLLALASSPYGDNPLFWNLKQKTKEGREDILKPTNPNAQKALLSSNNQYKVSPRPSSKIKPKSLHSLSNGGKAHLFEGLDDGDFSFGDDTFVPRKSVKKLVLRKGSGNKSTSDSSSFLQDVTAPYTNETTAPDWNNSQLITRSVTSLRQDGENVVTSSDTPTRDVPRMPVQRLFNDSTNINLDCSVSAPASHSPQKEVSSTQGTPNNTVSNSFTSDCDVSSSKNRLAADITASFLESDLDNSCLHVPESCPPHPTGIVLTRPDYYTMPSLDDITGLMDEKGQCLVEDFTIGREGYGNLFFPGVTNVTGMDLDDIVHFRRKEVVVYPDDDKKPPLGQGLNKKAQITLDCVWPMDKTSRTPIMSPERLKMLNYAQKIEETTTKIGGKFIDYRIETGSWVFEVNHFSKYGLLEDSDDDDLTEQQKKALAAHPANAAALAQKLKIQQKPDQLLKPNMWIGDGDGDKADNYHMDTGAMMEGDDFMKDKYQFEAMDEIAVQKYPAMLPDDDFNSSLDSKYLASTMGVSARHIQGMKASFFADECGEYEGYGKKRDLKMMGDKADLYDEEISNAWMRKEKSISSGLFGAFKHPGTLSLPQSPAFSDKERDGLPPFQKSGLFDGMFLQDEGRPKPRTFLQPPVMEHPIIPTGLDKDDLPPRIVGTQVRHSFLHAKDCLLYKNQKSFVDAACYMGRSFRVGWGPSWTLTHAGFLIGSDEEEIGGISLLPSRKGRISIRPRHQKMSAHMEKIQAASYLVSHSPANLAHQEDLLQVQLQFSQIEVEDGCPLMIPQPGVEALHRLSATVGADLEGSVPSHPEAIFRHQTKSVLTLCEALWGNLPDGDDLEKSETYRESQLRREAFSAWLAEVSAYRVSVEIENSSTMSTEGCLKAIFSKLSVREISSACMLAQKGRDHRLALLIAESMSAPETRQYLRSQLGRWAELDVCQFINEARQKVYCLLAGELVWSTDDREINTCQGLDWKRSLALHLWYKCQPNASIQQALRLYQLAFSGTEEFSAYCARPLPPYLEKEEMDAGELIYDTAYHLLCLYCDKTYGLEALLSPTSSSPSHMDYTLSWHLLQILQALEYQHLSPHHTDVIHTSFASQLESQGLWHWAAFALLHIRDAYQRQSSVQALLHRHLHPGDSFTPEEVFLVEKLLIPAQWLHQAKAVRAHHQGDQHAEARHLLLASNWNEAHQVVLRHIAPDAIINDNDEYLKGLLDQMASPECCSNILNWAGNGKVFLDFINLRKQINQMKQGRPTAYDLEALQPEVMSLCTRVKGLQCHTAKDYLCQAEMSKTAANLLRTFLMLQGQSPTSHLTRIIPELPMPEDFSLQELQALSAAALMEVA